MPVIPFIQYKRPDGRPVSGGFDRPEDVCSLAQSVMNRGVSFCAEVLVDGTISLTAVRDGKDIVIALSLNGPEVLSHVDRLVRDAHAVLNDARPTRQRSDVDGGAG